jgi:hypothetical protein
MAVDDTSLLMGILLGWGSLLAAEFAHLYIKAVTRE